MRRCFPILTSLCRINKWPLKTVPNSRPICLFCQPLVIDAGVSRLSIRMQKSEEGRRELFFALLVKCPRPYGKENQSLSFRQESSWISTRMISSPIWQMHSQGMMYSLSRPRKPQIRPGPGMIRAVSFPVLQSNVTSVGHPRLLQVQVLITSFCFNSHIRIGGTLLTIYLYYYMKGMYLSMTLLDCIDILLFYIF